MIDIEQFAGHTPGPWETTSNEYDKFEVISNEGHIVAGEYGIDDIANARLSASAPCLLAEVVRLREVLAAAQEFIAKEYSDPSQQEAGEWLAPEARNIHGLIVNMLHGGAVVFSQKEKFRNALKSIASATYPGNDPAVLRQWAEDGRRIAQEALEII